MENEIIVNEEVREIAEDIIVEAGSKTDFTKVAGLGLALIVGGIAYKKVIKPYLAKRKADKESSMEFAAGLNTDGDMIEEPVDNQDVEK